MGEGLCFIWLFMQKIPQHIVLFPDGNRRWARQKNLPIIKGHQQGFGNLIEFCKWAKNKGVKVLTAFGFSTENWKRPKAEVNDLVRLFERGISSNKRNIKKLHNMGIKINIIGQKEKFPKRLQGLFKNIENLTKNNRNFCLNLAVSYGGKWDILQAVKNVAAKGVALKEITEDLIEQNLSTAGLPLPDLILRPGGEKRLSNFLLWQSAYAEIYFSSKLWPDFTEADFNQVLNEYAKRQRRFGS